MTFPFVSERVEDGRLNLHGVWNDIAAGEIHVYNPVADRFAAI